MDLQHFIEETIRDVTVALHNSNKEMIENGFGRGIADLDEMKVDFDIAVTVATDRGSEVGGKITVLGLNLQVGGSQKQKESNEHISRIKFTVPVKLNTLGQTFSF